MPGGNIDTEKTSQIIINEFKSGKLGQITLESVDDIIDRK